MILEAMYVMGLIDIDSNESHLGKICQCCLSDFWSFLSLELCQMTKSSSDKWSIISHAYRLWWVCFQFWTLQLQSQKWKTYLLKNLGKNMWDAQESFFFFIASQLKLMQIDNTKIHKLCIPTWVC